LNRSADLEELKKLGASIDKVTDLDHLKPIFFRIEELATQYPQDVELAAGIAAVKAHLVQHGQRLINLQSSQQAQAPTPAPRTPVQPPFQPRPVTQSVPTPPPTRVTTPQQIPPPKPPQAPHPPATLNWKWAVTGGAAMGALIFAGLIFTVRHFRKEEKTMVPGSVQMEIRTNPPGASIRIDNQEKCKSNCKLDLPPGSYQIQAVLLGYETSTTSINAAPNAQPVDVTLQPIAPVVRLFTDLTAGKVFLDDQPAGDLQGGQLVLDHVAPGTHKLKISSQVGDTEFQFEASPGRIPEITGPVKATNMLAVIVSNFTTQAKVFASANLKISVDGVPNGEVGQQGLELKSLTAGDRELTLGEGKDQQKVLIGLGAQPAVTAFLKLNLNAGTIVVTTGEDGVKVLVNDRDTKRLTQRGQLRLPGVQVGNYTIKVEKDGFNQEPAQKIEVKRGEEARVEFKMRAIPKLATLRLRGAVPGATIFLDKDALGAVQADGTFAHANIPPGDHTVEIRRERFSPKRISRQFKAGETVELTGADVNLERAAGTIHLSLTPADARVTVKRSDEPQGRAMQGSNLNVAEGTYTITARANGYVEKSVTVQIVGGETKTVDVALTREREAVQQQVPTVKPGTISDFENAAEWYTEGEYTMHKGGNFVLYGRTPVNGTFTFRMALVNGKRLQWYVNYTDSKNYVLFQMDKKHFYRRDVVNGKSQEFKVQHGLDKQTSYQFQIDVSQNAITHNLYDGASWRVIDTFNAAGRNLTAGKFGLLIPGKDIFGVSNFRYQPK
jgi:PEGA domain